MSILKNLYNGNELSFSEKDTLPETRNILDIQDELFREFPEAREHLERYFEAYHDYADKFGFQQFSLGVRTGAELMLEILTDNKK